MIFRYDYPGGVWVDLEQPTSDEIRQVAEEFSISERIETELLSPTPSPLTAGDHGTALLVLHFPVHETDEGLTKNQEIDFVVGSHFLLTVRYDIVVPLYHLKKALEAQKITGGHHDIATDVLLEILFAHLYTAVRDYTDHTANRLERVEEEMFNGKEHNTVRAISNVSREFLHLESALASQEESLLRFLKMLTERNFFGASFAERAQRIQAEHLQVSRLVRTHRAITTEIRETNAALIDARQNSIMKTLTLITVIVLPLELIAVTFDIHANGTPFLGSPDAFKLIIGLMLCTMTLMTIFFARKRWL